METNRKEPARPDPDMLLAKLKQEEATSRGRLRLYLGMAPGVGKTYAMLNEGRRRMERGTDVAVGYVETYGRPLTVQALEGLNVIPRRAVNHRGVILEEMDTDAIIRRHPTVALIDELAHTNAPGSKHDKRWQDVEEVRDHGITVISTLNVQHIESLNDLVENITGIAVRETVPDWIVDEADEVEIVDMSPEALRARMRHGNVYPPTQARAALENFFTEENLAALRRLALERVEREAEERVDQFMRDYGADKLQVTERILVAVNDSPLAKTVLRRAWRMAGRRHADLVAVHVDAVSRLPDQRRRDLESNLRLAEDLGAEIHRLAGRDVARELANFALSERVTQIVIGHPRLDSPWWRLGRSVVTELLRQCPTIDIHIVGERGKVVPGR